MNLAEYARYDGLGLAALVARGEVTPRELAATAARAIAAVNPQLGAVVECYADRIEALDESTLGSGPFRGVPFLMKDVYGHEAGRRMEFGSRLCQGMVTAQDSGYCTLARAAGLNLLGRSAAPEFSMAGTTEGALYGNTSNPWRPGYSAGGSSGGAMAAVAAGMVPVAQGSDIGGSIRIPASYCGGVGLKPSRGRVSFGPALDENGWGLSQNFAQARSIRDVAALLDVLAVPQPGDPFVIPRPSETYSVLARQPALRLRIGWSIAPLMGVAVQEEVAATVQRTARLLHDMGHQVEELDVPLDGLRMLRTMMDVWYFGFDQRLRDYAARTGRAIGPDTLEPVILKVYEYARRMPASAFLQSMAGLNEFRRQLGQIFMHCDVWLTPTTPTVALHWGQVNLGRADIGFDEIAARLYAPVAQFVLPHNVMGTPALSLPLGQAASGLPVGVQLAGAPAMEHLLLQLGAALEEAAPWKHRVPLVHVSRDPAGG